MSPYVTITEPRQLSNQSDKKERRRRKRYEKGFRCLVLFRTFQFSPR